MRKLSVNTFLTLDGVMQAPGGPEEDPSGGFAHGGWSVNYWDEKMGQVMGEAMSAPFDLVLGRRTYEIFAAHWPHAKDDPAAKPLNDATKYVASRTLRSLDWSNSVLIDGDVGDGVAALKKEDGPELQVHGKKLFSDGTMPAGLKLVDSKLSTTGVVISTYVPAGEIVTGSFAFDEPTDAEIERRRKHEGE
jgi:dihydrofolate reductase